MHRAPERPWPSRYRLWDGLTAVGCALFVWFQFWQSGTRPAVLWPDSQQYEAVAAHPMWSLGFWAGQRPPLTPLLWKLTGTPDTFVFSQTAVFVVAWGVLAFSVGTVVPAGWRRTLAVFVVLGFATTTPVVLWNRSVLSETLSLAALAALFSACIWLARRPTVVRGIALVIVALACALSRDTQVWTVAMLGVCFAGLAAVRAVRERRFDLRSAGLAACLLAVAGSAIFLGVGSGRNQSNIDDIFVVRVFPFPARVAWMAVHGMPDAEAVDLLAHSIPAPTNDTSKYVSIPGADPHFARLARWMKRDAEGAYALWLATHPWYVVSEPLRSPRRAIDFNPDITVYGAVNRTSSPLSGALWPPWWCLIPLTALASLAGPFGRLTSRREVQVIALLAVIGVLGLYVAWHGDGEEVTRHMIEAYIQIRLACVILLALAFLVPAPRPSRSLVLVRNMVGDASASSNDLRARSVFSRLRRAWLLDPDVVGAARTTSLEEFRDRFRPEVVGGLEQMVEAPERSGLSAREVADRRDRKALDRVLGDDRAVGRVEEFLTDVYEAARKREA